MIVTYLERSDRVSATTAAGAFIASYASAATRAAYRANLRYWFDQCDRYGLRPLVDIRRTHIELYARELEMNGRAPATIAQRLAVIASFYRWCADEEIIDHSPATNVRRPRVSQEPTRPTLGRHELKDWLDAAADEGGSTHALACLLALNALRVNEAVGANVENLGEHSWHHTLKILGKGAKPAVIPLPPQTMQAVAEAIGDRKSGPLLISRTGRRMDRSSAARTVRRLARTAGITKNISPHSLRHAAITAALNAGVALRDVQDFARHADPRTTIRYDHARRSLDRHASYAVMQYVAGSA